MNYEKMWTELMRLFSGQVADSSGVGIKFYVFAHTTSLNLFLADEIDYSLAIKASTNVKE